MGKFSGAQIAAMQAKDHAAGKGPIPGHERLTLHDQMRAMNLSSKPRTSPVTGVVESPRRSFMKSVAQRRAGGDSGDMV